MYKKIFVAIDNSLISNYCIDHAITLSKQYNALLVGCHVYDATLHQRRFRDMEKGLPSHYQDEDVLQKQRDLHTSLINMGLKLISESYLDVFKRKCQEASVPHEGLLLEGKNYYEIINEVQQGGYDLVIIGAQGLAAVDENLIGSVCERVVRRINTDVLVVKSELLDGNVLVAVDGSDLSSAGVKSAIDFAKPFKNKLTAISVYDPHYHRVAFESIAKVLSKEAGQIFRFQEQETLHEEIIDRGLAKIYQNHLDRACSMSRDAGLEMDAVLMDGKPYDQILKYIRKGKPSLLIMGRTGIHNTKKLDIGSTSENLLRLAPCNVLLSGGNVVANTGENASSSEFRRLPQSENKVYADICEQRRDVDGKLPGVEDDGKNCEKTTAKTIYPVVWTQEAKLQTERIPSFVREVVRKKIEEYAQGKGYREITSAVVNEAKAGLMNSSIVNTI